MNFMGQETSETFFHYVKNKNYPTIKFDRGDIVS